MAFKRNQLKKLTSIYMMRILHALFHPVFMMLVFFVLMGNFSKSQTISLTAGTAVCENFNTLPSSGTTTTLPNGWYFSETGTGGNTTLTANDGSVNAGDSYSYGLTGNTERALGGLRSGTVNPTFGARFVNNTAAVITTLNISYTGETWRVGTASRVDSLIFQYSTNATSLTTGTWVAQPNLKYSNTAAAAIASGSMLHSASISNQITGLNIAAGAEIWIRWTDFDATGADDGMAIDDFCITAPSSCVTPTALAFLAQPSNTTQDATMTSVTVKAICSATGLTATSYTGAVTLTASGNGCGYVSQTVNAVAGVATFSNIVFTRSIQTGISLTASATGLTSVISSTFNITAPATGTATITNIATQNFEGAGTWAYTIGTPTYVGTAGSGVDFSGIKLLSGNNVLAKSFTFNNAAGDKKSTNTFTFNNVVIPATYDNATFNFKIGSIDDPAGGGVGVGVDNGDNLIIQTSLDGGTTWNTLLTYLGSSDYVVPLSATPITALAYNANVSYAKPSALSAFSVVLPTNTTQFQFRMTATNNRINENWVIDDVLLVGTTIPTGAPNPLPIVSSYTLQTCPNSSNTLSVVVSNTQGLINYSWSPNTNISSTTISNPVITPTANIIYTVLVTDADGCKATGTATVEMPTGTAGTWNGTVNTDWFYCKNWGGGIVPISSTNVAIATGALNHADIDATSAYAPANGIAYANNLTINNSKILSIQANANLKISGNLTIQNAAKLDMTNGGLVDISGVWSNTVGALGFTAGLGTINYQGTVAQTIAPENYYNLSSSSTGARTISPTGTVGIANVFSPGTNSYSFTNSTINYNGAINQNIASFVAAVTPGKTYNNLIVGNAGTKSLAGAVDVEGKLNVNNNIVLSLGNFDLTLKSTVARTANVGIIPTTATIAYNTGRFVVERYLPTGTGAGQHGKSWQFLSTPTNGGQTIKQAWQEGASFPNQNLLPGYGTQISSNNGGNAAGAYSLGFDMYSPLPSMKTYTNTGTTASWVGVPNTTSTPMYNVNGYMVFVRGSRIDTAFNQAAESTTLRTRGKLLYHQNLPDTITIPAGKFQSIGNPYASRIDMSLMDFDLPGNPFLTDSGRSFYCWDPTLAGAYGLGGYQTFSPVNDYYPVVNSTNYPLAIANRFVQSGQAFLMYNPLGTNVRVAFNENMKADSSRNTFKMGTDRARPKSFLRAYLFSGADSTAVLTDGISIAMSAAYNNAVDPLDANKIMNSGENLGVALDGKILSIVARKMPVVTDTIQLYFSNIRRQAHQIQFAPTNLSSLSLNMFLVDRFMQTTQLISKQVATLVAFDITTDPMSYDAKRFYICFARATSTNNHIATSIGNQMLEKNVTPNNDIYTSLEVYPNPIQTSSTTKLQIANLANGKYQLKITNMLGQLIQETPLVVTSQHTAILLHHRLFAKGIYAMSLWKENKCTATNTLIFQ